jgi:hypothetical protein
MNPSTQIVGMWHTHTHVGDVSFEDYFEGYVHLKLDAVRLLVEKYDLNCFVLTSSVVEKGLITESIDRLVFEENGVKVYFREKT